MMYELILFFAIIGSLKMEQRCPICLDDVSSEDSKCCKCETLYHADCKPKDRCATCRHVYD